MAVVVIDGLPGLLGALLDCAEDALDPTPGRVLVAPGGEVAWDACCDGQLWVRVVGVTDATDLLGMRVGADGSCQTAAWRVDIGVGVLRCTPTVDDRGRAPAADDLTGNAGQLLEDMAALAGAVACCAPVMRPLDLAWLPLGPEGGCAGGEWTFGVIRQACPCPEEE